MKKNIQEYFAFLDGETRMPSHLKPKKEERGRLYENPFMERITRTPIWVPQLLWLSVSTVFFWYSATTIEFATAKIISLGIAGFITRTLMEYIVHRLLYHTETNSDAFLNFQHKGHGFHHQHPKDPERLAMPPVPGIIISSLFFLLFYLTMKTAAFAFFPGFMLGYLFYITVHYYQHRVKSPR